jgi:hypothetical protein
MRLKANRLNDLKQAGCDTRQRFHKRSQPLGKDFARTGADITKAFAHENPQAHPLSTRWEIPNAAEIRAMEPLCWGTTERTAGVFASAMSGDGEDLITHLDLYHLQILWQPERSHFHPLHLILLQSFYCCRTIYRRSRSK